VVVGGGLAVLWFALIRTVVGPGAASIDVLKVAFTAVAGVGGAVALVVAYRRQNDLEQGRFVERFSAAAAQLGNPDPAVRIAGVYAMAGVADESTTFSRRQQCIDVLCGYLRLPYDPEQGRSHRTELVTTTTRPAEPPATTIEEQVHQRFRENDREVRQTIMRIITAHLQPEPETPINWSGHDYDFTTVLFEDVFFRGATFSGKTTSFAGATFSGNTWFAQVTFGGQTTSFERATFRGQTTSFDGAIFGGQTTRFTGATFSGQTTWFGGATFCAKNTWFDKATFRAKTTSFTGATFRAKTTRFDAATFSGETTSFERATFTGESVSFEGPHRWQNVIFDWDDYPDAMPVCIRPRNWPPPLASDSDS
jgi:uncharacterized protein YjbI with pentapeptide repeats